MTGNARKKLLIKSAIQILSEKNYQIATVADIASTAGVTVPMIYKHFESKKSLYLEVLNIILEKTIKKVEEASSKGENPIEKLKIVALHQKEMMGIFRNELKVQFQAFSEIDDPEVQIVISKGYNSSFLMIEKLLKEGVEGGYFKKDIDTDFYSKLLIGHTVHLNAYYLTGIIDEDYPKKVFLNYLEAITSDAYKGITGNE